MFYIWILIKIESLYFVGLFLITVLRENFLFRLSFSMIYFKSIMFLFFKLFSGVVI